MAYFRNSTVNLLNLHYAIHSLATTGGGAFFAAYLVKAGVPPAGVFLAIAGILAGRFAIRPFIIGLAARFGVRALVIAGSLLSAVQYPLLAAVHGPGLVLYLLCAMSSLADTFYWPCYHAYFATLGDDAHRGHQLGAREAVAALAGVVSPLLTGWLLVSFGPQVAFGTTAVIVATSGLPLLWTPEMPIAATQAGAFRAALPGVLFFLGDGFLCRGLCLRLAGGAVPVAEAERDRLSAARSPSPQSRRGRRLACSDASSTPATVRRAVFVSFGVLALIVALRAASIHDAALAVFANALGALGTASTCRR